jgi:hypothetical protein
MGGSAAGRLTSTYLGSDPTILGATGGSQSSTLVIANLPPYTPTGVNTGGGAAFNYSSSNGNWTGGTNGTVTGLTASGGGIRIDTQFTNPTWTGTPMGGTSTPVRTLPPILVCNYILYVGA